jgi:hypothetical protein
MDGRGRSAGCTRSTRDIGEVAFNYERGPCLIQGLFGMERAVIDTETECGPNGGCNVWNDKGQWYRDLVFTEDTVEINGTSPKQVAVSRLEVGLNVPRSQHRKEHGK